MADGRGDVHASLIEGNTNSSKSQFEQHTVAAIAAWKLKKFAGWMFWVGSLDAVLLINLYVWVWVTDDGSVANYLTAWHIVAASVAVFVGLWRDDLYPFVLAVIAVGFIALFTDSFGMWFRIDEREGSGGLEKQRRKDIFIGYQAFFLAFSFVYIVLGSVMLARLDAGPLGRFFDKVDQGLLLIYYSLLREDGYVEKAVAVEAESERSVRMVGQREDGTRLSKLRDKFRRKTGPAPAPSGISDDGSWETFAAQAEAYERQLQEERAAEKALQFEGDWNGNGNGNDAEPTNVALREKLQARMQAEEDARIAARAAQLAGLTIGDFPTTQGRFFAMQANPAPTNSSFNANMRAGKGNPAGELFA